MSLRFQIESKKFSSSREVHAPSMRVIIGKHSSSQWGSYHALRHLAYL